MTSALKLLALGLVSSVLSIGCNRENEEQPMTPANATGQPRQVPDSRYDDKGPSGERELYPDPVTTPPERMHAPGGGGNMHHDGSVPPSDPDPTNPGLSPTAPVP